MDTIYCIWWYDWNNSVWDIEIYDIKRGRWLKWPDLNTPRDSIWIASINWAIYIIAGSQNNGYKSTNEVLYTAKIWQISINDGNNNQYYNINWLYDTVTVLYSNDTIRII